MYKATIFALLVSAFLIFIGFVFQKNKTVFKLQIFWAWILIAFNTGGMDYIVHLNLYNSASLDIFSFFSSGLYLLICYIAKSFTIDFFTMNLILNTFALIVVYFIVKKMTVRYGIVGSLFLIYPIIENIIQKRNFLSSIFVLIAFYILFKKEKGYKLKSFLLIFLASLIHQTSYFYFIFWLFQQINLRKVKKIMCVLLPISFLMIPILPKVASLIFPASKVQLYFYDLRLDLFDSVCWIALHVIFVIISSLFYKNIKFTDDLNKHLCGEIYKMNIISLFILPLYYYESTFIRVYRNLMIFNYILVSNYKNNILTKNNFYLLLLWFIYLIAVFFMVYVITGIGFVKLVVPEFENNLILKILIGG